MRVASQFGFTTGVSIMSKIRAFLLLSTVIPLAACGADDIASPGEGVIVVPGGGGAPPPPPPPPPPPSAGEPADSCPQGTANVGVIANQRNCQVSGVITGNLTLANLPGVIYSLSGRVQVGRDVGADGNAPNGAQGILTIEAGVRVFGSQGADFLLVSRGSQLYAEGNANEPIVFTSRQNIEGTAGPDDIGQWGGIVILGRAPISSCIGAGATPGTADCQGQVEGTSGEAFYGGGVTNDNSGRIRYVQVRYAGFTVTEGNELNGITIAGVGAGTTLDHIQVHNGSDDGIEWFGGINNARYLVLTGIDDDSLDVDNGYKGAVQFVIAVQRANSGDKIIEGDSPGDENSVPRTDFEVANATFVGSGGADALNLRGGMDFSLINSVVTGAPACIDIDGNGTIQGAGAGPDEDGPPVFAGVYLACDTPFKDDSDVTAAQIAAIFNSGPNNTANGNSTLQATFINGQNESDADTVQASTYNSFFVDTDYIGAVEDANDTWWQNWTCGLGTNSPSCTAVPENTA